MRPFQRDHFGTTYFVASRFWDRSFWRQFVQLFRVRLVKKHRILAPKRSASKSSGPLNKCTKIYQDGVQQPQQTRQHPQNIIVKKQSSIFKLHNYYCLYIPTSTGIGSSFVKESFSMLQDSFCVLLSYLPMIPEFI